MGLTDSRVADPHFRQVGGTCTIFAVMYMAADAISRHYRGGGALKKSAIKKIKKSIHKFGLSEYPQIAQNGITPSQLKTFMTKVGNALGVNVGEPQTANIVNGTASLPASVGFTGTKEDDWKAFQTYYFKRNKQQDEYFDHEYSWRNIVNTSAFLNNKTVSGHRMVVIATKVHNTAGRLIQVKNSWQANQDAGKVWMKEHALYKKPSGLSFTTAKSSTNPTQFVIGTKTYTFNDLAGNTLKAFASYLDKVGDLKKRLSKQIGISAEKIGLIYDGNVCDDDDAHLVEAGLDIFNIKPFHIFYQGYDTLKKKMMLNGQNYLMPKIYERHNANPLLHKIGTNKISLGFVVYHPKTKKINDFYGPFYNVSDNINFNEIQKHLKNQNLSFNSNAGVFYKNSEKSGWTQIIANQPLSKQIKSLNEMPYLILHVIL